MELHDYVVGRGGTATLSCPVIAKLAADSGCSAGTLYMIARGHKVAGPKLARRIERATDQAVSRRTLRPDVFGTTSEAA